MRVSNDYIMRQIAGEFLLVPTGAAAAKFNGLITMNDVGRFIFQTLAEEHTVCEVAALITKEYDVDENTAIADTEEFVQQLRQIGALVDDSQ